MTKKNENSANKYFFLYGAAALFWFCLAGLSHSALENGSTRIYPALTITSGGVRATVGGLTLDAASIGGLTDSESGMSGGGFVINSGAAAASVVIDAAQSGLSSAHCYPVPFRPSLGHTRIRFTGLTGTAKILIYSLSGEQVKTIYKSDSNTFIDWNVKNERGENVFSGVYLYAIKTAFETKTGKLMIIR